MNALNNLKTSVKLIGSFLIVVIIAAVVGAVGIYYLNEVSTADKFMYENYAKPTGLLVNMSTYFQRMRINTRDALIAKTPEEAQKYIDTIQQLEGDLDKVNTEYASLIQTEAQQKLYDSYDTAYQEYKRYSKDIVALAKQNKMDEGLALMRGAAFTSAKTTEDGIDAMATRKVTQAKDTSDSNTALSNQATTIMIIVIIVAGVVGLGMGIIISNSIANPLGFLTKMANALAVGDLVRDVSDTEKDKVRLRKDEIGMIGKAFDALINYMQEMGAAAANIANNDLTASVTPKSPKDELGNSFATMVASLQDVIGQVAASANNLGAASEQLATAAAQAGLATSQIAKTVQQVAQGTNQQSEATSRTAKSMEQMSRAIEGVAKGAQEQANAAASSSSLTNQISEMVRQVAGNADAVTRDSANAAKAAREGSSTVESTIDGMRNIQAKVGLSARKVEEMGQRSDQIGTIVETIDDIASQTNLLALNAAIEAARAGEHGKGFAVVADEVRKLAERSSSATKEINGLIRGIQKTVAEAVQAMNEGATEVENGVTMANEAGRSLNNILTAAEAVFSQAEQAAKGTQRMSVLADQMVAAADTVSSIIEENTASTEEMSANSTEVVQAIENIAAVSEENSASAEEVSASTEEMSAQVEEVTASAEELSATAQELRNLVAQFKLANAQVEQTSFSKKTTPQNGIGKNARKTVEPTFPASRRSYK
jgi:methyl-accepting chemotaxis protein